MAKGDQYQAHTEKYHDKKSKKVINLCGLSLVLLF
ncbi:hypothetical protein HMPREF9977_05263 [Staphylococcus epidermidis NIHLM008]|nr:hypothetical protein HMPREF9977_05263 [Staphylococcus epidermidis NIHLM008]